VFPEIRAVRDAGGENTIVVIRVPQSDETPHAIAGNTKVYLRTGKLNTPEELATIHEIEWLQSKRRKSEELRDRLNERAFQRCRTLLSQHTRASGAAFPDMLESPGWLTLSACPRYPKQSLKAPPDMSEVYDTIKIRDWYGTFDRFPPAHPFRSGLGRIVQDAMVFTNDWDTQKQFFYTELNCFGLYYYRQNLQGEPTRAGSESMTTFRASEVLARIDEFLDTALRFYDCVGYWALLQFDLCLDSVVNCGLMMDWPRRITDPPPGSCPDTGLRFTKSMLVGGLKADQEEVVLEALQYVMWAFGWDVGRDRLGEYHHQWQGYLKKQMQ
jgi:hypothetical protein